MLKVIVLILSLLVAFAFGWVCGHEDGVEPERFCRSICDADLIPADNPLTEYRERLLRAIEDAEDGNAPHRWMDGLQEALALLEGET